MKIKIQILNMTYVKHFIFNKQIRAKMVYNIWYFTKEAYSLMKETDAYVSNNNIIIFLKNKYTHIAFICRLVFWLGIERESTSAYVLIETILCEINV